ncbi:DUF3857 domain-containing transglutaminase family protein [Chitinimonas sp. PSY-7]|uniref:DUF3857 domain-containing protein n=1 Tax=Chitinimonas sp. PSY-7 TaxID=3459088 RepID=UPI004040284C
MKKSVLALAICLQPLSYASVALGDDPSALIEKARSQYRVETDGSYVFRSEVQVLLQEKRALQENGQQYIYLNKQLDKLLSLEAYTLKADGRKVVVSADQIKTQADPASSNAPMFNDSEYKVIVFPDLDVGDRIYFSYSLQSQPMFPGYFGGTNLPAFHPYKESTIEYDLPESLSFKAEVKGYAALPTKAEPGRKMYAWRYEAEPKDRIESGSVAYVDYGHRLQTSTFKDYAELAKAYEQGARDKAASTPKITALAQELTHGVTDDRSKALILSNWVRKNIRYVAIYLGRGGVVPHAAEDVLNNRYGDCKDHTTLLEAMLAAVNIDSSTALVNLGNSYRLPEVPVASAFDHAITYIPSLDLYVDSTAEALEAGFLSPALEGKPALLTRSGQIAHLPLVQQDETHYKMNVVVKEDGTADIKGSKEVIGLYAEVDRHNFLNTPETDRNQMIENLLLQSGLKGKGQYALNPAMSKWDRQGTNYDAKVENFAAFPGMVGLSASSTLTGGISGAIAGLISESARTQPFLCASFSVDEEANYVFPKGTKVVSLPKPVKLKNRYFDYDASYRLKNREIKITRALKVKSTGQVVCNPADFKAMLPSVQTMLRDIKSQIVVEGK